MQLIADLHIHSKYSMATSGLLDPVHLDRWARLKGLDVVGTGDITHPAWTAELAEALEPAEPGLFRLKPSLRHPDFDDAADSLRPVRFLLGGEVCTIYKQAGRTRKVHHVVLVPDRAAVTALQRRLSAFGNLAADGRPILHLGSRDLLEIVLETHPDGLLIPAHIWTPWFSVLGARSGFDRIEDCYGDLSPHIVAVETGLSSDPAMNWRCSHLDRYRLVSNSDAHSPEKLGREATLLNCRRSYAGIAEALRGGRIDGLAGTVEFFPEQGKYHHDGHRHCAIHWSPEQTRRHHGRCPVCGRPVTIGVLHRVEVLADRPPGVTGPHARPFHRLLSLKEILAEILEVGPATRTVQRHYHGLLQQLGSEFDVLLKHPPDCLAAAAGDLLAEAVARLRRGDVCLEAGYDGRFGRVRLFTDAQRARWPRQRRLRLATG